MELVLNPRSHHALYPELPATPVLCSYKPSDSYHNEAVALSPDTLDLVDHLQGSARPLRKVIAPPWATSPGSSWINWRTVPLPHPPPCKSFTGSYCC